ncbi:MAG: Dabb family protein [Gammaproteobacteria bacterium]
MIRHTALFRFNDGVSAAQITEMMAALLALKNDVPQIERVVWGKNFSQRANGHTHVVSIDFPDRAALAVFYDHPAHRRIAETLIKPITASFLIVDYEERSSPKIAGEDGASEVRS